MRISGKQLSERLKTSLVEQVAQLKRDFGREPSLAVILVGDNPSSMSYVRSKAVSCESVGIRNTTIMLPSDISQAELLERIEALNADDKTDGILVQLPLPAHINTDRVIQAIDVDKDVDGFHPANVAALWLGRREYGMVPCTPKGIIALLEQAGESISGKNAVVVGRSNIVGLPVAKLLLDRDATVTIAHSKTADLASITSRADILVAAVGHPGLITADMVKEGCVVIDVGISRNPETGKLCGDVDTENVEKKARCITPVPGGVGPMTVCCLLFNTVECFEKRMKAASGLL